MKSLPFFLFPDFEEWWHAHMSGWQQRFYLDLYMKMFAFCLDG